MGETLTVRADEVLEGDFLPGLDNGYVYEEPESDPEVSVRAGWAMVSAGEGLVRISFHTADGDEAFIVCPPDMPVTVRRGES